MKSAGKRPSSLLLWFQVRMVLVKPLDNLLAKIVCQFLHFVSFLLRNPSCSFITADISLFPEFI
jgi:hypothetical protein